MILPSSQSVNLVVTALLGLRAASAALFILMLIAWFSAVSSAPLPVWFVIALALVGAVIAACAHRLERLAGAS